MLICTHTNMKPWGKSSRAHTDTHVHKKTHMCMHTCTQKLTCVCTHTYILTSTRIAVHAVLHLHTQDNNSESIISSDTDLTIVSYVFDILIQFALIDHIYAEKTHTKHRIWVCIILIQFALIDRIYARRKHANIVFWDAAQSWRVYVCMYTCTYVYMYDHGLNTHMPEKKHTNIVPWDTAQSWQVYACIHVCIHVCMYLLSWTQHTHAREKAHKTSYLEILHSLGECMYICIHVCMYTCMIMGWTHTCQRKTHKHRTLRYCTVLAKWSAPPSSISSRSTLVKTT
jgi:hypothetical protein